MSLCWITRIATSVNLTSLLPRPFDLLFLFHLPFSRLQIHIKASKVSQPGGWWAIYRGVATLSQVSQLLLVYLLLSREEVCFHAVEVRW